MTEDKKARFLVSLAEIGKVTKASEAVGVLPRQIYRWLQDDPDFQAAFIECRWAKSQQLIEVAEDRGEDKSDLLLMFTIKGLRPEYREGFQVPTIQINNVLYQQLAAAQELALLDHAPAHLLGQGEAGNGHSELSAGPEDAQETIGSEVPGDAQ